MTPEVNLFSAISGAVFLGCLGLFFHYIAKHPEYMEDERKVESWGDFDSGVVQSFINARWNLQYEIRECKSLALLSELYWEIERLEMDYRDTIPDQLLIVHIDELFAFHSIRAGQIKTLVFS